MREQWIGWWSGLTGRERRIIQAGVLLIVAVLLPVWAYLAAAGFRADAAARLDSAQVVQAQVDRIVAASTPQASAPATGDRSLRGRVLTAAQWAGVTVQRIEDGGARGVRVVFEPADSRAIYRWISLTGQAGLFISSTTIIRVEQSDLVAAEFEVRDSV